mmetsp:Transcript_3815/g.8926  ORF Transcript_3815/g.8926 Transcript_3815/m.8926 type:complete len:212 (-) Transcript_3815:78-713(-)
MDTVGTTAGASSSFVRERRATEDEEALFFVSFSFADLDLDIRFVGASSTAAGGGDVASAGLFVEAVCTAAASSSLVRDRREADEVRFFVSFSFADFDRDIRFALASSPVEAVAVAAASPGVLIETVRAAGASSPSWVMDIRVEFLFFVSLSVADFDLDIRLVVDASGFTTAASSVAASDFAFDTLASCGSAISPRLDFDLAMLALAGIWLQ